MKQIIFGDIHGRRIWKKILQTEEGLGDIGRVIFIGDYLDTHDDILGIEQLRNLEDIIEHKKKSKYEIILLVGNHDHHYFPAVGYTGTSGYQPKMATDFGKILQDNIGMFRMAFQDEYGTIYSHAGVARRWYAAMEPIRKKYGVEDKDPVTAVNILFKTEPKLFCYNQRDFSGYGDHPEQTPIWIRPDSLYANTVDQNMQVVGHTSVKRINHPKGHNFYMIDALAQGEYLTKNKEEFVIKQQL